MDSEGGDVCGHEVRKSDVGAIREEDDVDLSAIVPRNHGLETDENGEDVWRCYRRTNGDDEKCLFHTDPETRRERYGVGDGELAQILLAIVNDEIEDVIGEDGLLPDETSAGHTPLEIVTDGGGGAADDTPNLIKHRRLQFVGATFGNLNFSYEHLSPPNGYNVVLAGIEADTVNFRLATVDSVLVLAGSSVDELVLRQADTDVVYTTWIDVDGDVSVAQLTTSALRFDDATVRGKFDAYGLEATSAANLRRATVDGDVTLTSVTADEVKLSRATVGGSLSGDEIQTERATKLYKTTVTETVSLDHVRAGPTFSLSKLTVENEGNDDEENDDEAALSLKGLRADKWYGSGLQVDGDVVARDTRIRETVKFDEYDRSTHIGGDTDFSLSKFDGGLMFENVHVTGTLDLTSVDIHWYGSLRDTVVDSGLKMKWSTVEGEFAADRLTVHGTANFYQSEVRRDANLDSVRVADRLMLKNTTIEGELDLSDAEVGSNLQLDEATVSGGLSANQTVVEGNVTATDATVKSVTFGPGTFVAGDVLLSSAVVEDDVTFHGSVVSGTVVVDQNAVVGNLSFTRNARFGRLSMESATVHGTLELGNCRSLHQRGGGVFVTSCEFARVSINGPGAQLSVPLIGGPLVFEESVVADELAMPCDPFVHPGVRAVSLAGSVIPNATLSLGDADGASRDLIQRGNSVLTPLGFRSEADDLVYDLSGTTIGNIKTTDLASCEQDPYYQLRFWMTEFDRFRFGEHRSDFEQTDWAIHELRRWGDPDIAVITGENVDADRSTVSALSPHFVEAHGAARAARLDEEESGPPLESLASLSVSFPTLSDSDVTDWRERDWTTDETPNDSRWEYRDAERAILRRDPHDHSGEVIAAVERLRYRFGSSSEKEHLVLAVVDACLAVTGDGGATSERLVDRVASTDEDETANLAEAIAGYLRDVSSVEGETAQALAEAAVPLARRLERSATEDAPLFRDAMAALLKDIDASPHDASKLWGFLQTWDYRPEARVRNDVWNDATARAYESAAETAEEQSDERERLQQLEGTYTLAKHAAGDVGENTAASKFYYRERRYGKRLHDLDGRWLESKKNAALRLLTGYGEKPLFVVGWSVVVMLVWTALYGVVQQTLGVLPDAGPLELLVFSVGSFATILPTSPLAGATAASRSDLAVVQLLSEVEALLGVFLVAVFVFTLTRSLQR